MKESIPVIPLTRPALLIGRHSECDVRLANSPVSRFHCCVAMAYDRILIRDLGSRHGVRVNGSLVEEARLFSGDEVAIGPLIFRLTAETEVAAEAGQALRSNPTPSASFSVGEPSSSESLSPPPSTAADDNLGIDLILLDDEEPS